MDDLKKLIREIPDYPKPGILFYDLTTLLKDKSGFRKLVDKLCDHYTDRKIDIVVGVEARGFIFAPALAYRLGAGFVPVRKPKKLPAKTAKVSYQLEYGTDTLEIHEDAIRPGQNVIISDDLLATGGTAAATVQLVRATRRHGEWRGLCGGADVPERPLETTRPRRFLADSLRRLSQRRCSSALGGALAYDLKQSHARGDRDIQGAHRPGRRERGQEVAALLHECVQPFAFAAQHHSNGTRQIDLREVLFGALI